MPAKKQITKDSIIDAALEEFRENGMEAINARSLARRLGCSTQPIYLSFSGMEELKLALTDLIVLRYKEYVTQELASGKYPPYKAYGMGYIRFASEEHEMFRYLFMRARNADEQKSGELNDSYQAVIDLISEKNGIPREVAEHFHFEVWAFVHGIAAMLATSYLDLKWEDISEMLTDCYQALLKRYQQKEENQ